MLDVKVETCRNWLRERTSRFRARPAQHSSIEPAAPRAYSIYIFCIGGRKRE
jgi:hypothetical protein